MGYHGYSADAKGLAFMGSRFRQQALEQGYVLAYLDGTAQPEVQPSESGYRYWNSGSAAGYLHEPGANNDDVNFTASVVMDLVRKFEVNPERIFAFGISNGGSMAIRAACERPDLFAAVAVSGACLEFRKPEVCAFKCDAGGDCDWNTNLPGCRDEDWVQTLPSIFQCSALLEKKTPVMLVNGLEEAAWVGKSGYLYLPPNGSDEPDYSYPPLKYMRNYFQRGFGCGEKRQTFSNGTQYDWSVCDSFQNCSLTICSASAGDDWYGESYNETEECLHESSNRDCEAAVIEHRYGHSTDTMDLSDSMLTFFGAVAH